MEQGRSVAWGRALRLSLLHEILLDRHPLVAERLARMSSDVESFKQLRMSSDVRGSCLRTLSSECGKVVAEMRQIRGLEGFFGTERIDQLLQAASHGPIIVLNAHAKACDALVLRSEVGRIVHFSLDFSAEVARIHCDELRSQSSHTDGFDYEIYRGGVRRRFFYNATIHQALGHLWISIVKPLLDILGYTVSFRNIWVVVLF